jgi:hypothetical protein
LRTVCCTYHFKCFTIFGRLMISVHSREGNFESYLMIRICFHQDSFSLGVTTIHRDCSSVGTKEESPGGEFVHTGSLLFQLVAPG